MTTADLKPGDPVSFSCFSATILSWQDLSEDGHSWRAVKLRLDTGRVIECDWLDIVEVQAQMEVVPG